MCSYVAIITLLATCSSSACQYLHLFIAASAKLIKHISSICTSSISRGGVLVALLDTHIVQDGIPETIFKETCRFHAIAFFWK